MAILTRMYYWPEYRSDAMDQWADQHGITFAFVEPGKSVKHAFIKSFNGRFRDECPTGHRFLDLATAKATIERWRLDYNAVRPFGQLGGRIPKECVECLRDEKRRRIVDRPATIISAGTASRVTSRR